MTWDALPGASDYDVHLGRVLDPWTFQSRRMTQTSVIFNSVGNVLEFVRVASSDACGNFGPD